MPDDPGNGGTPAEPPAPTTPPAGTPETPADSGASNGDTSETLSLEEARKLRSELKNLRKRATDAEAELQKRNDADLSETEKLKKQLAERDTENGALRASVRKALGVSALAAAGCTRPNLLVSDLPEEAFEDETGKALEKAAGELRKSYPELYRSVAGNGDGAAGGNSGRASDGDMNAQIRRAAGRG